MLAAGVQTPSTSVEGTYALIVAGIGLLGVIFTAWLTRRSDKQKGRAIDSSTLVTGFEGLVDRLSSEVKRLAAESDQDVVELRQASQRIRQLEDSLSEEQRQRAKVIGDLTALRMQLHEREAALKAGETP